MTRISELACYENPSQFISVIMNSEMQSHGDEPGAGVPNKHCIVRKAGPSSS